MFCLSFTPSIVGIFDFCLKFIQLFFHRFFPIQKTPRLRRHSVSHSFALTLNGFHNFTLSLREALLHQLRLLLPPCVQMGKNILFKLPDAAHGNQLLAVCLIAIMKICVRYPKYRKIMLTTTALYVSQTFLLNDSHFFAVLSIIRIVLVDIGEYKHKMPPEVFGRYRFLCHTIEAVDVIAFHGAGFYCMNKNNQVGTAICIESDLVITAVCIQARGVNHDHILAEVCILPCHRSANVVNRKNGLVEQRIEQAAFSMIHTTGIYNENLLSIFQYFIALIFQEIYPIFLHIKTPPDYIVKLRMMWIYQARNKENRAKSQQKSDTASPFPNSFL